MSGRLAAMSMHESAVAEEALAMFQAHETAGSELDCASFARDGKVNQLVEVILEDAGAVRSIAEAMDSGEEVSLYRSTVKNIKARTGLAEPRILGMSKCIVANLTGECDFADEPSSLMIRSRR